jgi:hypothetical protein
MTGAFYLATAQTQLFDNGRLNPGTAIEASFVKNLIGNCYAQRKVVVLDCCFGAAFADGFLTMDDGGVDVQADLGGEGYVVLTAATARNYALEQEGEPLSVYTRYLVEGCWRGKRFCWPRRWLATQNYACARRQNATLKLKPLVSPPLVNAISKPLRLN